jgi:hypothetical protein
MVALSPSCESTVCGFIGADAAQIPHCGWRCEPRMQDKKKVARGSGNHQTYIHNHKVKMLVCLYFILLKYGSEYMLIILA